MTTIDLNTPPTLRPDGTLPTAGEVESMVAKASGVQVPIMEVSHSTAYELPCGIFFNGQLLRTAQVRELTGFDEEKLAHTDIQQNVANYVTELLTLGVVTVGGEETYRNMFREMLLGDRDALILAIRRTTYGDSVEFEMDCEACENKSQVIVDLATEIETRVMEDARKRDFDVELRHGTAKVTLLNGYAQESFSENIGKKVKTQAAINTLMLAKSVTEINGKPTYGQEDSVRGLTSGDRATLLDFIADLQPGPQLQKPINANCATCGKEYPITLGLANLFRF